MENKNCVTRTQPTEQPVEEVVSMEDLGVLTNSPTAQLVEENLPVDTLDPVTNPPTAQLVEENLPVDTLDPVTTQPTVVQVVPASEAPVTVRRRRPQHFLGISLPIFLVCILPCPVTIFCSIPAVILSAMVSMHSTLVCNNLSDTEVIARSMVCIILGLRPCLVHDLYVLEFSFNHRSYMCLLTSLAGF